MDIIIIATYCWNDRREFSFLLCVFVCLFVCFVFVVVVAFAIVIVVVVVLVVVVLLLLLLPARESHSNHAFVCYSLLDIFTNQDS